MKVTRLFEYLDVQKNNLPLEKSLGHRVNGEWKFYSTDDIIEQTNRLSQGLLNLGLKKGDRIGIISYKNRPEWMIVDLACQQIGVVNVPVYPTISPREYQYIFNDSGIKYCFIGCDDLGQKVAQAKPNIPSLEGVFAFDKENGETYWETLFADPTDEIEARKAEVKADEMATIIYTSGTTGNPKGVMLSHENLCSIIENTGHIFVAEPGDSVLSFLPLCHIFERTVSYAYLKNSSSVYVCGTDNLGGENGDIRAVQPVFFTCVPRLLEKVYEAIYNKGLGLTGVKKKLFFWALDQTDDYEYNIEYSGVKALKMKLADKLIFSKWREALGGKIKCIVTGAAPMPLKIARIFSAAGIPIREGYGLTESSPTITVAGLDKGMAMLGTVGPVIPCMDVVIDREEGDYKEGEGEILACGPNVMMGYLNLPEKTAETIKMIDGKRYLRTGDVGKVVKDKNGNEFLKITDRKKELLKTSGGKYVAPAPIENKFKEDFLIEQMMVVGDAKKFVSALIVPAEEALKSWCDDECIDWTNLSDMIKNEKVIERYQNCCVEFNPNFSHIEQIKKFTLLDTQWEAVKADGSDAELTPTLKLKRRVILAKCQGQIDAMYS